MPDVLQKVALHPREITDILYNQGMGIADFHFGFDHLPTPGTYPRSTVAYFRWSWADLEPAEGQCAFDLIDRTIEQAKAKGERLAFRVMSEYQAGSPAWLLAKGVPAIADRRTSIIWTSDRSDAGANGIWPAAKA